MAEKRGRGRPPGAVSKAKRELAEMSRDHAETALNALVAIVEDSKSPAAARVSAASAILDRGYGKPPQFTTGDVGAFKRASEMTDDELAAIAAGGSRDADPPPSGTRKPH